MGRFDIFPIFIATFASRRVTLIATHSKSQKQTRLPIRYLYFILPFKLLINKEVIKVFQNYINSLIFGLSLASLSPFHPLIFLNSMCEIRTVQNNSTRLTVDIGSKPIRTGQ